MNPRLVGVLAALASVACVLAQDVAPQWSGFHTWQYAATLGLGLVPQALVGSRLVGPAGNIEFFALVRCDGTPFDDRAIDLALAKHAA